MSFEPKEIVACAKHIAEDSNRGFWMKLGAQIFESLLSKARYILSVLLTTPENELDAAVEKDAALKAMMEQMQQLATSNQQFAELVKEALQNRAHVANTQNTGVEMTGGTLNVDTINVGTTANIEKQINVKQEGFGNTQTNTFS